MFSKSSRPNEYQGYAEEDWIEPERPRRDWKKVFLVIGLGTLSWVATYVGMLELIQANMGKLDFTTKIVVGFSVAMLMTMIIWLLDQMFASHPFGVKLAYVTGYIFLTLISVGFGFGFYWKVLESRSEASRSAESAVSQVQASLVAGAARLDQLQSTLEQLTLISQEKAVLEREQGTTCPNSRPGDGPRRRLRDDDAGRFSFASNFVKGRGTKVKQDMRALDGDLKKITSSDASTFDKATGTRNKFLQALSRKLELTATSFNAFRTDPQLRQIRSELADRANRSTFPTGRGSATFSCPDGQLQSALFGVVRAIDQLPELDKPEIATVEGAQAVVEAFRRLTATGQGLLVLKLPPSADELRALQKKAVRSVDPNVRIERNRSYAGLSQGGLSQRDYIPLSIAIFVDLCLLLVSIGRPMNRLNGLIPKMREAERGPVYQILSKFDDIHRDKKIREKFEVFRHVVFDFNGDYYVAVPLDAPRNRNPEEVNNLQLEAHLLANLFASFEKERIFSRVYNPLLSRKTIQKKLWRQGSKFAASQAFRTYRFRDGAWSDIILGAVMGAARRARAEHIRHAKDAGPQLDVPSTIAAAAQMSDDEARARAIIADTLNTQTKPVKDGLNEHATPAATAFADAQNFVAGAGQAYTGNDTENAIDAASMAAQFGPYADHLNKSDDHRKSASKRLTWPYQKAPEAPGEADVDLLPANSNTSPAARDAISPYAADDPQTAWPPIDHEIGTTADTQASARQAEMDDKDPRDNVIVMPPRQSAPAASPMQTTTSSMPDHVYRQADNAAYTDVLAHALSSPQAAAATNMVIEKEQQTLVADAQPTAASEMLPAEATPSQILPPPLPAKAPAGANATEPTTTAPASSNVLTTNPTSAAISDADVGELSMKVRITQRTADFQIPVSTISGARTTDAVRAGMHKAFSNDALAFTPEVEPLETSQLIVQAPNETVIETAAEPIALQPASDDTELSEIEFSIAGNNDEDELVVSASTDEDLEAISRRFAPKRDRE